MLGLPPFLRLAFGAFVALVASRAVAATVLADADAAVEFDVQETGVRLTSFADRAAPIAGNLLNGVNNSRLFDLTVVDTHDAQATYYGNGGWQHAVVESATTTSATIRQERDNGVRVTTTLRVDQGKLYATYRVDVPPTLSVLNLVALPLFVGPFADTAGATFVHYPNGSGVVEPVDFAGRQHYELSYPTGRQSYQMMGLFNDATGLYFATHDPDANPKSLAFSVYPHQGGLKLRATLAATDVYVPGNSQSFTFPTVFGVERGDWYDAALFYRRFASRAPW